MGWHAGDDSTAKHSRRWQLTPRQTVAAVVAGALLLFVAGSVWKDGLNAQLASLQQAAALARQMATSHCAPAPRATADAGAGAAAASESAAAAAAGAARPIPNCANLPPLDTPRLEYEAVVPDLSGRREDVLPDVAEAVLAAERAGRGRKIISMSLYGATQDYWSGAIDNAHLVAKYWPGWTLRIYYSPEVPECPLRYMLSLGAELVRMPSPQSQHEGMFWRFSAMGDRTATRILVRDSDGRLSLRDKAAVDEWVASGRYFHAMRDSAFHTEPIMGCCFGTVGGFLSPAAMQRLTAIESAGPIIYGVDQQWLKRIVWPLVKNYTLHHASYHCHSGYGYVETRGFPTQRAGAHDFVGNRHRTLNLYMGMKHNGVCPLECRRHREWEEC